MAQTRRIRTEYFRVVIFDHRRKMKEKAIIYKGGKCEKCEYSKCKAALEFHHPDPNEKDFSISHGSYGWDKIKLEIDKCELLCCRCHREIHDEWNNQITFKNNLIKEKLKEEYFEKHKTKPVKSEIVNWPDKIELERLINLVSLVAIGKNLGVSGQAVLNHCKKLGIKTKPPGYWSKPNLT